LVASHQLGFGNKHSATDQVRRVIGAAKQALEEEKIYSAIFQT
jgi:hypothetical protein